mmetsp:Transcript_29110/g.98176  ORF Transcript_29110/g.98176 Transcript_29110/m.98176 type:complete len:157 (+) Transcript_29110:457-927(+)
MYRLAVFQPLHVVNEHAVQIQRRLWPRPPFAPLRDNGTQLLKCEVAPRVPVREQRHGAQPLGQLSNCRNIAHPPRSVPRLDGLEEDAIVKRKTPAPKGSATRSKRTRHVATCLRTAPSRSAAEDRCLSPPGAVCRRSSLDERSAKSIVSSAWWSAV